MNSEGRLLYGWTLDKKNKLILSANSSPLSGVRPLLYKVLKALDSDLSDEIKVG